MKKFLLLKILIVAMFLIAVPFAVFAAEQDGDYSLMPTAVLYEKADTSILNVLLPFKSAHTMNLEAQIRYYMYAGLLPGNVFMILVKNDMQNAGSMASCLNTTLAPNEGVLTGSSEGGVLVSASLIRPEVFISERGYNPEAISAPTRIGIEECYGGMGGFADIIIVDANFIPASASQSRLAAAVFPGNQPVSPGGELAIASLIRPLANSIVV